MKGLELSRSFFDACAKDEIEKKFPGLSQRIAVGLAGEGSECFGFDDEISCDHDFEPGFCLWLSDEDYEKYGFELERFYSKLPKEYGGYSRQLLSPVGGNRHGVMTTGGFYEKFTGSQSTPLSTDQWLYVPPSSLACATNGEVFYDASGEFSRIRNELLLGYPQDILLKKLAAHTIMMVQSGLYNYTRCIKRGENGSAQLSVFEFVRHTISVIYLLNNKYEPFYKWAYRGMRELAVLSGLEDSLVALTELGNSADEAKAKAESIEEICTLVAEEINRQKLSDKPATDLEKLAATLQNSITDTNLRNYHIMDGI